MQLFIQQMGEPHACLLQLKLENPMYYQQAICVRLIERIDAWCRGHGGEVNIQTDWLLSDDTVLRPDVYYVSRSTLSRIDKHHRNAGAPDLCIEVWSPSNDRDREDLDRKARAYLNAGALAVWLIYHQARMAKLCCGVSGSVVPEVVEAGLLEDQAVLPGFSCRLTEIL